MAGGDPFDLNAQEQAREQADKKAELRQKVEIDDLKWLMSNRRGRRVVYRLLERAGAFRLSFHTNALQMAFNEGGRNQGLATLALLMQHCPELHMEMLKEHSSDE
jgi:hypothetical protein